MDDEAPNLLVGERNSVSVHPGIRNPALDSVEIRFVFVLIELLFGQQSAGSATAALAVIAMAFGAVVIVKLGDSSSLNNGAWVRGRFDVRLHRRHARAT